MPDPKPFHCRHLFGDGHQCGSPALRGENLCFYHHGSRRPQNYQTVHGHTAVALPEPTDLHAIQRGLCELLRLTLAGTVSLPASARAHAILATAAKNIARIDRQNANLLKADPHRAPVTDYVHDPALGTIAPAPLTEAGLPAQPEPRPEGPLPNPTPLFTLKPHTRNVETAETAARYEAFNLQRLKLLGQEIEDRRTRFEGLPLALQVEQDHETLDLYPDLQTYPPANEDFGPRETPAATPLSTFANPLSSTPTPTSSSFAEGGGPAVALALAVTGPSAAPVEAARPTPSASSLTEAEAPAVSPSPCPSFEAPDPNDPNDPTEQCLYHLARHLQTAQMAQTTHY